MNVKCFSLLGLSALALAAPPAMGAIIQQGDVTANLSGDLFLDDARTGGGDATQHDNTGGFAPQRFFDLDGDGTLDPPASLDAPGLPGVVTIEGFGFATSASATANDASEVDISFVYLGADEAIGGGDDVTIGSEVVGYNFAGAGEYYVNFDTDISASIDGLGRLFRVLTNVVDNDPSLEESIRFKQRPPNELMYGNAPIKLSGGTQSGGVVLSVSGTFTVIPEPASAGLVLTLLTVGLAASRRKRN